MRDCVALVTGASRGIGKGIALELGQRGATVYVTGTTTDDNQKRDFGPGTIQETAAAISHDTAGKGIALVCNHEDDNQVQAVMDRIAQDHGRLDILVNNCFRLPPGDVDVLYDKFWEQGAAVWDTLHNVGLRSHFVATCLAMPLLMKARADSAQVGRLPRPYIAMVSSFGGLSYTFNAAYGVAKAGVDRLAKDMSIDLDGQNIAVNSFYPGVVLTERTLEMKENGMWDARVGIPLQDAETPEFTGKAIAAVALDENNLEQTGKVQVVAELAEKYGFTDADGKQPPSIRSLRFLLWSYAFTDEMRAMVPSSWVPNWKLPFGVMAQGRPPKPSE